MDIIEMAREIGKAIQKEDLYLKLQIAQKQSDEDEELQNLIGEFNLKRMAISNEASKSDRDEQKRQQLNQEMRSAYAAIMKNQNMINYNNLKQQFDNVLNRIVAIITQSAQGADPETTDYNPSCGGDCSGCSGCG